MTARWSGTIAVARWVAVAALLAQAARAQDAASRQALREWNQPRGCADLSASIDVEPIVRAPVEAWKIGFKELYAEPVAWGGVVFVAGMQQHDPMLYAFDLATGKSAAVPAKLNGAKPAWLAAWQGFVALVRPDGVQILSLRGGQFANTRKLVPLASPGPPSVLGGQLFVCDLHDRVHCIDLDQAKDLGEFPGGTCQPALVALDDAGRALVGTIGIGRPVHPDPTKVYTGQFLSLDVCEVSGLGKPSPSFHARATKFHGELRARGREREPRGFVPARAALREARRGTALAGLQHRADRQSGRADAPRALPQGARRDRPRRRSRPRARRSASRTRASWCACTPTVR